MVAQQPQCKPSQSVPWRGFAFGFSGDLLATPLRCVFGCFAQLFQVCGPDPVLLEGFTASALTFTLTAMPHFGTLWQAAVPLTAGASLSFGALVAGGLHYKTTIASRLDQVLVQMELQAAGNQPGLLVNMTFLIIH